MNRALLLVTAVLAVVVVAFSVAAYPSLPAEIPTHFGVAGADRYAARSLGRWLSMPLLALGLCALNYLVGALFANRPQLMNIPRKQRLLALPPEKRRHVMRWWWVLVQTIGVAELVLIGAAQYGLWRAAMARAYEGRLVGMVVAFVAFAMVPLSLVIVWQMRGEVERQEREPG